MRHTDGEWELIRKEGTHIHLIKCGNQEICETRMPSTPDVFSRQEITEQAEANAKLISASPDLLEACMESIKIMESSPSATGLPYENIVKLPHYQLLKTAISKATH